MITHLEPDILECEVKWALGRITMNKASRGEGVLAKHLQILKNDAVIVLTQYTSRFGKLSMAGWTEKGQFFFQSHSRTMAKNVQTTV